MESDQQLEAALIERGLLKPDQLKRLHKIMEQDKKSLKEVIREQRIVFPEQLAQVQADLLQLPYIDLGQTEINEAAMENVSKQAAATYRFYAFGKDDTKLQVAMESPDDFQAREAVKFIAKKRGLNPDIYVTSKANIDHLLGGKSEIQAEIGGALRDFSKDVEAAASEVTGKDTADIEQIIEEAPVTKVVAVFIRHAIEGNASDIHVEPSSKDLRIRYRIDGELFTSLLLPIRVHSAVISRIKILSRLKIDENRLPQDGRFSLTIDGHSYDFRVSTMPTVYGEKVALRILDKTKGAPSLTDLGLIGPPAEIFTQHLELPNGIILISGPTGAGKSTTLFSSLGLVNKPDINVSTLEDPVEYEIAGVNQTQINPDIGLSFASGLRNLLRQDPDVIMVGEIRDRDTAALSVHAALTGHLVLSTIHTNDAIGAVPRLVDMGIDPFLLTASLRLVAAQRLVTRLCQECLVEQELTPSLKDKILAELSSVPDEYKQDSNQQNPNHLYISEGCPACSEAGSIGRLAIFEIVPMSRQLRDAISSEADYDTLQGIARQLGLITMRQDGILKALAGQVHYEDVLRVTSEN